MPSFETPDPIVVAVELQMGAVRVFASERADTVVDVLPSDASNPEDVRAAAETRVDLAGGRLSVRAPKLRSWLSRSGGGSIDVTVEVPAGSDVAGTGQMADFDCEGPLGDCRIKTGLGQIRVDRAAQLNLRNGAGDIGVESASGHADLAVGSGEVRVGDLGTSAVIKNSNGDVWVGAARGELRLNASNGSIAVGSAAAGLVAKSSNGDVRVDSVGSGNVVLETRIGDVEVGIPEGTAAWLDVSASAGKVLNRLEAGEPGPSAPKVEVRARTSVGNVVIRRPQP